MRLRCLSLSMCFLPARGRGANFVVLALLDFVKQFLQQRHAYHKSDAY